MLRVAIIGRSNVGKTTIFNSLVGERVGLENDSFNTTRDVNWRKVSVDNHKILVADTGGNTSVEDNTSRHIHNSIKQVITDVDLIFFVVDARTEPTYYELELLKEMRNTKSPIHLVFNKTEGNKELRLESYKAFSSRWEYSMISAIHRKGIHDLKEVIIDQIKILDREDSDKKQEKLLRIGFIGRTNAGKSSLTNVLSDSKDKILVLQSPHTTRDSISKVISFEGRKFELVDTAGMFRKSKKLDIVDWLSLIKSEQEIRSLDVIIMLHDASMRFSHLDKKILGLIIDSKTPFIIAFNKLDIIDDPNEVVKKVKREVNFFPEFEFVFVSAITEKNIKKMISKAFSIYDRSMVMYDENTLRHLINSFNFTAQIKTKKRRSKLVSIVQSKEKGNHFTAYFSKTDSIHFTIRRQLVNHIKNSLGMKSIPIKVDVRIR